MTPETVWQDWEDITERFDEGEDCREIASFRQSIKGLFRLGKHGLPGIRKVHQHQGRDSQRRHYWFGHNRRIRPS